VVFTPLKLITVIDDTALIDRFAVTVTLLNGAAANARHISAVPRCVFVRCTSVHVSPPPVTLVTLLFVPVEVDTSAPTNASSNSLEAVVENAEVTAVVAAEVRSPNAVASTAMPADTDAVKFTPVAFAELIVTAWFNGAKMNPLLAGVTV
jgi:hypothetical protein